MKVAQILRRIKFDEWGGTENVVWNTTRALGELGVAAEILSTRVQNAAALEVSEGVTIRRFPYRYPYFPLSRENKIALDKKGGNPLCPAMEHYLTGQPFDLIHCHNLGRLAELSARVATRRNIPFILSLHGGSFDIPRAERMELAQPLQHTFSYGVWLEHLLRLKVDFLKRADGIICIGENEAEEFLRRYPAKSVCFLPNGVDPAKFMAAQSFNWRRELELQPDTRLILNVSRIDYQKNQKMLIDLVAALRDRGDKVHLLLIGPVSSGWYGRELEALIEARGVKPQVTLIPGMRPDDARLTAAYSQADVFIMPSLHEPFGIVALEAWSAGVPVLAADVGGLARLIEPGRTGLLFRPDSLPDLLAAYDSLPPVAEQLREAGRNEVAHHYNWKIIASRLKAFYDEVFDEYRAEHPLHR